ncbi:MAG: outer membrane lipoprotein LolB [Gammaproteobacteria bacterium]|nr:outer membrane lipoprotein LolB [Gammaproteobacteria bacterium]
MRFCGVVVACLVLLGCESLPELAPNSDGGSAWQQQQAALRQLHHWQLNGRVAITHEETAWNLSLQWRQQGDDYWITLSGPFGAGKVVLNGNSHTVQLQKSDQQVFNASSAEELLFNQTGVTMPVSDLRYWVLGLPAPHQVQHRGFDFQGHLLQLQQSHWQVNFRRYAQVEGLSLPDKVFMVAADKHLEVRLVVDEWQLPK